MTRHLLLLRHAEAGPYAHTEAGDRARALTGKGVAQAAQTASALLHWTAQHDIVWSAKEALTLCSPAQRTRQTADIALQRSHCRSARLEPDTLYSATAQNLLEHISSTDEHIQTLLLVGHNPAIEHLAYDLIGPSAQLKENDVFPKGYPPSTLTLFSLADNWYAARPSTLAFLGINAP
ncbi:phosphohistidine phosphatase [Neokomagataea tanensis]|uniref:Phosphohistidine phosphatase n=1 Tax=Neokomagataea tanensis TaxID=661191 RepID=A0A4Y6V2N1_9PROT|nr:MULTISPECIES: histidine phosphatase family protein [Neokomagataea]QDH24302.1 phosphohistidine phosphatase [Neokomagataea tanensis]